MTADHAAAAEPRTLVERAAGRTAEVACVPAELLATDGWALYGGPTVLLRQHWCDTLATGRSVFQLGAALYLIGHEAAHVSGIVDESAAACFGLSWVTRLAAEYYGLRRAWHRVTLMRGARWLHSLEPEDYHRGC